MKKVNPDRAFIGDVITTNALFTPKNKAGRVVDLEGKSYRGIIVSAKAGYFGVRFGAGLEFTNPLDGLLSKPVGCALERREFEVDTDF